MTILSTTPADARLSLPQALLAYWMPARDALPREVIYDPGKTVEQVSDEDAEMMETAQDDAVVAALRADGQSVVERPAVYSVTVGGPAHQRLLPGDLVVSVETDDHARRQGGARRHPAGEGGRHPGLHRDPQQGAASGQGGHRRVDHPVRRPGDRDHPGQRLRLRAGDLLRPRPADRRPERGSGVRPGHLRQDHRGPAAPGSPRRGDRDHHAGRGRSVRSAPSSRRSPGPRSPGPPTSSCRRPTATTSPACAPTST